jgi:hypothetical protein
VAVPKGVASTDLKPVVVILSGLGEREFPTQAGQVGEIVDKAVNAALPDVFFSFGNASSTLPSRSRICPNIIVLKSPGVRLIS